MSEKLLADLVESLDSAWAKSRVGQLAKATEDTGADETGRPSRDDRATSDLASPGRRGAQGKGHAEARARVLADIGTDLRLLRSDVRNRSNRAFALLVTFMTLSGAVALVSAGLAVSGSALAASLSGVGTALAGGATMGFWRLYVIETRRADRLLADMQKVEEARVAFLLAADNNPGGGTTYVIGRLPSRSKNESK